MEIIKIPIELTLTEPMLGTVTKNKEVYTNFIANKLRDEVRRGNVAVAELERKSVEELETIDEREEKGWTGFHSDEKGLFIYDYMIRGFLKAAGQATANQNKVVAYRSKIDQNVFIFPRKIHFSQFDKNVSKPDGVVERVLRAMTMQGPRVSLAKSDKVDAGTKLNFEIHLLKNKDITEDILKFWFTYGQYSGLGQFRNGSYGRFDVKYK